MNVDPKLLLLQSRTVDVQQFSKCLMAVQQRIKAHDNLDPGVNERFQCILRSKLFLNCS